MKHPEASHVADQVAEPDRQVMRHTVWSGTTMSKERQPLNCEETGRRTKGALCRRREP